TISGAAVAIGRSGGSSCHATGWWLFALPWLVRTHPLLCVTQHRQRREPARSAPSSASRPRGSFEGGRLGERPPCLEQPGRRRVLPSEAAMTALCNMSIRELIYALSQVEDAIRLARLPEPSTPTAEPSADSASAWDDIGQLAAYEQRIVAELRRRR